MRIKDLHNYESILEWAKSYYNDQTTPDDEAKRLAIMKQVESSYNNHRNHSLKAIKYEDDNFALAFSNGHYSGHPISSRTLFLGLWYALAISDPKKSDEEKRELQKMIMNEIANTSLEAMKAIESLSVALKKITLNALEKHVSSLQNSKTTTASSGKHALKIESYIMLDDKQLVIKEMKCELEKRPDGPSKANYVNSLIENSTLSKFPSHQALKDAGLIKLSKTAWNNATRPYREAIYDRSK